jgi:hypothetical protein
MESMQITTGDTQVAQRFARLEQLSALSRPALGADLQVNQQADRVVADKEARDMWEAERATRVCGCPQCRYTYLATLDFYATLGTGQPALERINADYRAWYTFHLTGGQPDAQSQTSG